MDLRLRTITLEQFEAYKASLLASEKSPATINKYLHEVREFALWLGGRPLEGSTLMEWKAFRIAAGANAGTINCAISAVNGLLKLLGRPDLALRFLKRQRRPFRDDSKDITKEEYVRLVEAAKAKGGDRTALILETLCSCGLRVSELKHITLEAVRAGRAEIRLKGKTRTVLLPGKLCAKLKKYAKRQGLSGGPVFLSARGKPISRQQVWTDLKALCASAGVDPSKVFPHNLRHLFAVTYYKACRDVVRLADILGHSSVDTTRIYLAVPIEKHRQQLESLRLVI